VGPGDFPPDVAWPGYVFRQAAIDRHRVRDHLSEQALRCWKWAIGTFFRGTPATGFWWWLFFPVPVLILVVLLISSASAWACYWVYWACQDLRCGALQAGIQPALRVPNHCGEMAEGQASGARLMHALFPCDAMAGLPVPHLPPAASRCPAGSAGAVFPPLRLWGPLPRDGGPCRPAFDGGVPEVRVSAAAWCGCRQGHPGAGVR
jgi:hypothetical protein